jgi:hypothetical protein
MAARAQLYCAFLSVDNVLVRGRAEAQLRGQVRSQVQLGTEGSELFRRVRDWLALPPKTQRLNRWAIFFRPGGLCEDRNRTE